MIFFQILVIIHSLYIIFDIIIKIKKYKISKLFEAKAFNLEDNLQEILTLGGIYEKK